MARIDTIRELIKEYAQVKEEVGSFIAFENEENLLSATATVFIQLQRLPRDEKLGPVSPPSSTTGQFQTADKTIPKEKIKWAACPKCGKVPREGVNKFGKAYQACFDCQVFLRDDGTIKPMEPRQEKVA